MPTPDVRYEEKVGDFVPGSLTAGGKLDPRLATCTPCILVDGDGDGDDETK